MRRGFLHRGRVLLGVALTLLTMAWPAWARVQLGADVGWDNRFRPGRWTPVYVTLTDSAPRQVILEAYVPTDGRYAMQVRQSLAIGPQPVTVPLYLPLSYRIDEASITVRDANRFQRLAHLPLSDHAAYGTGLPNTPDVVPPQNLFIGISGNPESQQLLRRQLAGSNLITGYVPSLRLPAVTVGYEALDLLILNAPDLNRLNVDQQRAIAAWVRGGGLLVLWPGAGPVPVTGPLVEILPCSIGENRTYAVDAGAISAAGLPPRFATLKGRALHNPAADARPIPLLGDARLNGYRRWVGFGQVAILPVDASLLLFESQEKSLDFWRRALDGIVAIPPEQTDAQTNYYPHYAWGDTRESSAMRAALDWISDVPGAGRFGFSYLAMVMLLMMLIVGPVDWFVLKRLGRQPWTWVTTAGWIGAVTFGAIYVGHLLRSGELHFRTVSMIDEANGRRVATTDVAGIYSPQTRTYEIDVAPESWWRPASEGSYYGGGGLLLEIPSHQDYRGTRPTEMLIHVWNVRLLRGETHEPAAPLLEAKLSATRGPQVQGTITNRSPRPISRLHVRTGAGAASIDGTIEPGQSMDVLANLDPRDKRLTTQPTESAPGWKSHEHPTTAPARPEAPTLNSLADRRSIRLDEMLADRDDVACVYAEFEESEGRVRLKQAEGAEAALEAHVGIIRAVVPLQRSAAQQQQ